MRLSLLRRVVALAVAWSLPRLPVVPGPFDVSPAVAQDYYDDAASGVTLENAKDRYAALLSSGDRRRIGLFHRNLVDYVLGTISTMQHDPTGGSRQIDETTYLEIRRQLRDEHRSAYDSKLSVEEEITRIVSELSDPYSRYYSPTEKIFEEADDTQVPSIGIGLAPYFDPRQQCYRGSEIVAVYPDSPAERAGLKIGDLIVEVNGVSLPRMLSRTLIQSRTPEDFNRRVSQLLSGAKKSEVVLSIASRKTQIHQGLYHVQVMRDASYLKIPGFYVEDSRDSNDRLVAYMRLKSFTKTNSAALVKALEDRADKGYSRFIIDLRNNYGGVIQEAMLDASLFLPDKESIICFTVSPRGVGTHTVKNWIDKGVPDKAFDYSTPIVILVNEGTASSAEVFAASLHENGRATLLGARTYGKPLIQHFFPLPNGGALKLTVAEYLVSRQNASTPCAQLITDSPELDPKEAPYRQERCGSWGQRRPQTRRCVRCSGVY